MPLPSFLIAGTVKAGTTSVYKYCQQHPEVYMSPEKEPRFLGYEGIETGPESLVTNTPSLDEYQKLFAGSENASAVGEATPAYLSNPRTPERVAGLIPDCKIVVILRNPVDRAYSHYLYVRSKSPDHFPSSFGELIRDEDCEPIRMGFYHRHLKRWLHHVDREQMKILLFDDLTTDAITFAQEIYDFIEVDPKFVPDTSMAYAKSGVPRLAALHRFLLRASGPVTKTISSVVSEGIMNSLRQLISEVSLEKPAMSPTTRQRLQKIYASDVRKTGRLIGRDLSHWLDG